jgi:hypothetical protein
MSVSKARGFDVPFLIPAYVMGYFNGIDSVSGYQECVQIIGRGNRMMGQSLGTIYFNTFASNMEMELKSKDVLMAKRVSDNMKFLTSSM